MAALNSHKKDLSRLWQNRIIWGSPMSQFSTLKVGGPVEAVISVMNIRELEQLVRWLNENGVSWWIVGRGSNILVPDHGLDGVVIILAGELSKYERLQPPKPTNKDAKVHIRAGGGCLLPKLINFCTSLGLSGLEFAVGIPGTVGGAIVMNAGAWNHEIGNLVEGAIIMDSGGNVFSKQGKNLGFSYRKWAMPANTVLLSAILALNPGSKTDIKAACRKYRELRRQKQPMADASAGSFFKNPPEDSAGRLIEAAGLKGYTIGGAKISEKHANFMINTGKAAAADFFSLMQLVQQEVYQRFGIKLEPEVHILGGQQDK